MDYYTEPENEYTDDPERSAKNDMAKALFMNILTDDNPSPENGLTGLDQSIILHFGFIDDPERESIKREIKSLAMNFRGGCNLFGIDELEV